MRIAIMQPYFVPYAGYFRLMSGVDLFVVYDDAQMPYPGYAHRNFLTYKDGKRDWLTIPLRRWHLGTKIKDIQFADNMKEKWLRSLGSFPDIGKNSLASIVRKPWDFNTPIEFILSALREASSILGIKTQWAISSQNSIRPDLQGEDRVLAICEHYKATQYINAPGGLSLYNREKFKKRGVDLKFLTQYENKKSILERLITENPKDIRIEIDKNVRFQ